MAKTNKTVITSREVKASHYLDQWLLVRDSSKSSDTKPNEKWNKKSWILKGDTDEIWARSLQQVLIEELAFQEALTFGLNSNKKDKDEIKRIESEFLFQVKDWSYWEELEISPTEFSKILQRKWIAKNILQLKTKSIGVEVTEEEAKSYYESNRYQFGSVPFATMAANIKDFLRQQKVKDQLKDWFEVLKRKNKVQLLIK